MSKRIVFSVTGTTCTSCEVLIERELKQISGVLAVQVSHQEGCVELELAKHADVTVQDLERCVGSHGYRFAAWEDRPESSTRFHWKKIGGVLLIALASWYVLEQFGVLDITPNVASGAGFAPIFLIGLIASVSSCTAVLAGLILALSAAHAKRHGEESASTKLRPHLLFNTGRVLGFAFFGMLIGVAGSILVLSPILNALFVIVVAVLMIGIAVNLLDLVPKGRFQVKPPKWLAHKIHQLQESEHPAVPFLLGAASFFLPCGFTQSIQLYALGTGDPVTAAAIMAVFALGTAPALLGLGAMTSFAEGKRLKRVTQIAGILVLVLGFSQFQNGMTLLGFTLPDTVSSEELASAQAALMMVDGRQLIQMEVASAGLYAPDVHQVKVGIPVEWKIYAPAFLGCFDTIVSRGLGIQERLAPGMNTITFTPEKPGTYIFSCSMGMSRGTIVVSE